MTTFANWERVATDQGSGLEAYVVRGSTADGRAIVLLQEIFGINEALRDTAEMIAAEGYLVAVPDLFWRMQPRVDLGYDKEQVKIAFSYSERFDERLALQDIAATARHARMTSSAKLVHLLGFCLGGKLAVLGAEDAHVASAISLYGVGIERHLSALTHARCPLQLHFAGKDRFVPSSAVAAIEQAAGGRDIEIHVYPDAGHGFFARKRPGYQPGAAHAAWARAREFMQRASTRSF